MGDVAFINHYSIILIVNKKSPKSCEIKCYLTNRSDCVAAFQTNVVHLNNNPFWIQNKNQVIIQYVIIYLFQKTQTADSLSRYELIYYWIRNSKRANKTTVEA